MAGPFQERCCLKRHSSTSTTVDVSERVGGPVGICVPVCACVGAGLLPVRPGYGIFSDIRV